MKQFFAACALLVVVIIGITVAAGVLTFQALKEGNFLETLSETVPVEEDQKEEPLVDPYYGWTDEGVGAAQLVSVYWQDIEPKDDQWNFDVLDARVAEIESEPIFVLFPGSFPSPDIPWTPEKEQEFTVASQDFVRTIIERYGNRVTHWVLADSMIAWTDIEEENTYPIPTQMEFLAAVAGEVRALQEDTTIILPDLGVLTSYSLDEWLEEAFLYENGNWFDGISYTPASDWKQAVSQKEVLNAFIEIYGVEKQTWVTNGPSDIRFAALSNVFGDMFYGSQNIATNLDVYFRGFTDASKMELVEYSPNGLVVVREEQEEGERYIVWGEGTFTVPNSIKYMRTIVSGYEQRIRIQSGEDIIASMVPVILE